MGSVNGKDHIEVSVYKSVLRHVRKRYEVLLRENESKDPFFDPRFPPKPGYFASQILKSRGIDYGF